MKRSCYPQNSSFDLERIHGLDKSETSVVTDLIEFDSAEDRTSVVVVDWIEFDSAKDHLSVAAVDLIELECAEFLSGFLLNGLRKTEKKIFSYFVDALDSVVSDDFEQKVILIKV